MPLLYIHISSINTKALIRCSGIEEYNLAETLYFSPKGQQIPHGAVLLDH